MLDKDILYLKGVGPQRAEVLKAELGIRTWEDLLEYFPFRYIDRSQITRIADIQSEAANVQLIGQIVSTREIGVANGKRLTAVFRDESGDIELVWFKALKWLTQSLKLNQPYVLYGRPTEFKGRYNITHPELELLEDARITQGSELKPVYNTTQKCTAKGLHSNGIAKLTRQLIEDAKPVVQENLPDYILERFKLMPRNEAVAQVHMPSTLPLLEAARRRLKFEELFYIQIQLGKQKLSNTQQESGVVFEKVGEIFNSFYHQHLPFELTGAQKRVMKEIRADVARGHHMNRLIQGDVGSGKTIVALLAALLAIDNGYQVCLMVPTEILAMQHFASISELLQPIGLKVALLKGSTPKSERKKIALHGVKMQFSKNPLVL